MQQRLDRVVTERKLTRTRSQAESYIKLGLVEVNGEVITRSSFMVDERDQILVTSPYQYVSRAGLKLESVADNLKLDFKDKVVLDVGSSTGGFTDYALKNGADSVIAVEIGVDQLHESLKNHPKIELHERTDIRDLGKLSKKVDIVLIDVSFVSIREILPSIVELVGSNTRVLAMFKPQFETSSEFRHRGVIKNDKIRRQLMADFETWVKNNKYTILGKADSLVSGSKGNTERFYLLLV